MEATRDLGCVELWQESLERSLARRGRSRRGSVELHRLRPARNLAHREPLNESAAYSKLRRAAAGQSPLIVPAATGVTMAALIAAALPKLFAGASAAGHAERLASLAALPASAPAQQPRALPAATAAAARISAPAPAAPVVHHTGPVPTPVPAPAIQHTTAAVRQVVAHHQSTPVHPLASTTKPHFAADRRTLRAHPATAVRPRVAVAVPTGQYVNPLAGASVTPERIDQGIDYAGSGTLGAIGPAKVTYIGTTNTGWPGAFIAYQLESGSDSGRYVYYAEGLSPAAGLHVGEQLQPGQAVAQMTPGSSTGIEIGWAAGIGTETLAAASEGWGPSQDSASMASPAGKNFSALIASLGGQPGIVEG